MGGIILKKLIIIFLTVLMVMTMSGCSGSSNGNGGSDEPEKIKKIADDTSTNLLSFSAPEKFDKAERFIEQSVDGEIIEKDITFYFNDGTELTYAYAKDQSLEGLIDLDSLEKIENGDDVFYVYVSGSSYVAFAMKDNDLYAVKYALLDGQSRDPFDEAVKAVSFKDNGPMITNDLDLGGISYTIDPSLNVYKLVTNMTEDPDGNQLEKYVLWKYGQSDDEMDFRFLIRVFRNSTVEDQKKQDKEYEERTVNGISYTVLCDEGNPYIYYTQHGDDVYEIRNSGKSNGWFTSRSEESYTAFEAFVNSISFN